MGIPAVESATVVGVVNDYVYGNMYGKPDPVLFLCITSTKGYSHVCAD